MFSTTRRVSFGKDIRTWGDAGLSGEWATKPIALYGRNSISGTYEFFRENTLYGGDFKDDVKQQPGSQAVVQQVAGDKFAIGYSGIGFKTDGVRTVPLASAPGGMCYNTSFEEQCPASILSRATLYLFEQKAGSERSTRCAASSSNISCPKMARHKRKKPGSTRSPIKSVRPN